MPLKRSRSRKCRAKAAAAGPRGLQLETELLGEHRPVRQIRQRIVMREVQKMPFGPLAVGDLQRRRQHADDVAGEIVQRRLRGEQHPPLPAGSTISSSKLGRALLVSKTSRSSCGCVPPASCRRSLSCSSPPTSVDSIAVRLGVTGIDEDAAALGIAGADHPGTVSMICARRSRLSRSTASRVFSLWISSRSRV